jgi:hypothetical protein
VSHFLCGEIGFEKDSTWEELNRIAFQVARKALDNNLHVFIGSGIPQDIVYEILRRDRADSIARAAPFLVTASPALNTSEEVICPDISGRELEAGYAELRAQLQKISAIAECVFREKNVSQISLTFSEGFSPDYRSVTVARSAFVETCLQHYRDESVTTGIQDIVVPMIRVHVNR